MQTFGGSKSVNLHKAYKDTNYYVNVFYNLADNTTNVSISWLSVKAKTLNTFTIQNSSATSFSRLWYSHGYIA